MNRSAYFDIIIIGGGAAGCFAAVTAARSFSEGKGNSTLPKTGKSSFQHHSFEDTQKNETAVAPSFSPRNGSRIMVLEKSPRLLSKVRISGGGRCNLTHQLDSIVEMSKRYPRGQQFVKKTFSQFFTHDTVQWFTERGVPVKAEEDGRMFPVSDQSESVIQALLQEANKYGIQFQLSTSVEEIEPPVEGASDGLFALKTTRGTWYAKAVLVACGGFPKDEQFEWIRRLGHTVSSPVPSLFTFNLPQHTLTSLMGVSIDPVVVKLVGTKWEEKGPLLITHWGLSGPAVLRLSAWGARWLAEKKYQYEVQINWVPEYHEERLRMAFQEWRVQMKTQKINNRNPLHLPQRFWTHQLQEAGIPLDIRWADLPAKAQNILVKNLTAQRLMVSGKTTYKEEFVTAGGVSLEEVHSATMESKLVKGLYFAGEILDVDGITGGFNFQHAWTSGYIAGINLAKYL